ncbi:TRAP transporter small permease (plasmid) [Sinorhizobium meliloti]|nr:TRAP transporter small permease [Sinorhizobium meliloti]
MANPSRWRSFAHIEETLAAILLVFAFVVIALQIVTRFVFHDPMFWTEEAARYAFVWLVALGAAEGVTSRTHITMDIVPRMLPERAQLFCGSFWTSWCSPRCSFSFTTVSSGPCAPTR